MVGLISTSEADETPSRPAEPKAKSKPKPRLSANHKPVMTPKLPALLTMQSTPTIKSESSSASFTPESAADVNGLPALVARSWTTVFLPALYLVLYASTDPMAIGQVGRDPKQPGKEIVAILQGVLDDKYPDNSYVVEWGDAICTKVCSRG